MAQALVTSDLDRTALGLLALLVLIMHRPAFRLAEIACLAQLGYLVSGFLDCSRGLEEVDFMTSRVQHFLWLFNTDRSELLARADGTPEAALA
jgi:hypothetical protein